jgi:6-pyruvoyltetrahydropterin/6-carboxytetrahydropterin synthase
MLEIVNELDHRMLVATLNPLLQVSATPEQVEIRYRDKLWSFPRGDCALLPIENTTAELLAKYIANRILSTLKHRNHYSPQSIRVDVEESFGQIATYSQSVE